MNLWISMLLNIGGKPFVAIIHGIIPGAMIVAGYMPNESPPRRRSLSFGHQPLAIKLTGG